MALGCRCGDGWSGADAEHWWKAHLPQLTGTLTASARRDTAATVVSV
jgi:hypothetical protein